MQEAAVCAITKAFVTTGAPALKSSETCSWVGVTLSSSGMHPTIVSRLK